MDIKSGEDVVNIRCNAKGSQNKSYRTDVNKAGGNVGVLYPTLLHGIELYLDSHWGVRRQKPLKVYFKNITTKVLLAWHIKSGNNLINSKVKTKIPV